MQIAATEALSELEQVLTQIVIAKVGVVRGQRIHPFGVPTELPENRRSPLETRMQLALAPRYSGRVVAAPALSFWASSCPGRR